MEIGFLKKNLQQAHAAAAPWIGKSPVLRTKGTDPDFFIVPAVPVPIQYLYCGACTGGPCIAIIILCLRENLELTIHNLTQKIFLAHTLGNGQRHLPLKGQLDLSSNKKVIQVIFLYGQFVLHFSSQAAREKSRTSHFGGKKKGGDASQKGEAASAAGAAEG